MRLIVLLFAVLSVQSVLANDAASSHPNGASWLVNATEEAAAPVEWPLLAQRGACFIDPDCERQCGRYREQCKGTQTGCDESHKKCVRACPKQCVGDGKKQN